MSGRAVTEALDRAIAEQGKPGSITLDQGTAFRVTSIRSVTYQHERSAGCITQVPEKGFIESFNAELLR